MVDCNYDESNERGMKMKGTANPQGSNATLYLVE